MLYREMKMYVSAHQDRSEGWSNFFPSQLLPVSSLRVRGRGGGEGLIHKLKAQLCSQQLTLKNGCLLMSSASLSLAPSLFSGLRLISCREREGERGGGGGGETD